MQFVCTFENVDVAGCSSNLLEKNPFCLKLQNMTSLWGLTAFVAHLPEALKMKFLNWRVKRFRMFCDDACITLGDIQGNDRFGPLVTSVKYFCCNSIVRLSIALKNPKSSMQPNFNIILLYWVNLWSWWADKHLQTSDKPAKWRTQCV